MNTSLRCKEDKTVNIPNVVVQTQIDVLPSRMGHQILKHLNAWIRGLHPFGYDMYLVPSKTTLHLDETKRLGCLLGAEFGTHLVPFSTLFAKLTTTFAVLSAPIIDVLSAHP